MEWSERYNAAHEPSANEVKAYVDTPLWEMLDNHLRQTYKVEPKLFYSDCTMDDGAWKGWNVKFRKSGRPLCTLYPKEGFFVTLIPVGPKEAAEADLKISLCSEYAQHVYRQAKPGFNGKSLALEVTDETILNDVKQLVALRMPSRSI